LHGARGMESTSAASAASSSSASAPPGTQFTCCASTKVQKLTWMRLLEAKQLQMLMR
jgi:hypothetical protein